MALDVYFPEDIKAIGNELILTAQMSGNGPHRQGFIDGVMSLMRALKAVETDGSVTHVVIEGQYKMYSPPLNRKVVE
jgi:hypothetical protein